MNEDLTALKDKLITSQQRRIRELESANHQLQQDNEYIMKALSIALRERYRGTPLVISDERLAETKIEFCVDVNASGDHLIWLKGANK